VTPLGMVFQTNNFPPLTLALREMHHNTVRMILANKPNCGFSKNTATNLLE
jgi:hypothetical protein